MQQPPSRPPHRLFTPNPAGRCIKTTLTTGRCDGTSRLINDMKGATGGSVGVWSLRDQINHGARWARLNFWSLRGSNPERIQMKQETTRRWLLSPPATVTPAAVQSPMISDGFGHFLGLLNFGRASSHAENVCHAFHAQSEQLEQLKKKVPIQNLMLFSKHGVMQRAYWGHSAFFTQLCIIAFGDTQLMPLIHCYGIQMYNYH